jgi:hypothetical protein
MGEHVLGLEIPDVITVGYRPAEQASTLAAQHPDQGPHRRWAPAPNIARYLPTAAIQYAQVCADLEVYVGPEPPEIPSRLEVPASSAR